MATSKRKIMRTAIFFYHVSVVGFPLLLFTSITDMVLLIPDPTMQHFQNRMRS